MNKEDATFEKPYLNCFADGEYVDDVERVTEDDEVMIWNSETRRQRIHLSQFEFERLYNDVMRFLTETEKYRYRQLQTGELEPAVWLRDCETYIRNNANKVISCPLTESDFNTLMNKIKIAVFQYDIIQPLIDNENTSDIKICGPYDIRVRIEGKAYKTSSTFLDERDLYRFIESLGFRNRINILAQPTISFTDAHDANYRLRFTITSPRINGMGDYPYLHIRKISKIKPTLDNLIEKGMITENIKRYLIGRMKSARAIVFAGPPGSGKTTLMNAAIEYIPKTRECLVIQENDELFTEQSGFMFKHVLYDEKGKIVCSLEDLSRTALVEGCNVFIIGETKGGEARNMMTLVNAGGQGITSIHSNSARETLPKMADLVKYGSDYSFEDARYMLQAFDTVVYMSDYKVQEILEVVKWDSSIKDYVYRPIYRREKSY